MLETVNTIFSAKRKPWNHHETISKVPQSLLLHRNFPEKSVLRHWPGRKWNIRSRRLAKSKSSQPWQDHTNHTRSHVSKARKDGFQMVITMWLTRSVDTFYFWKLFEEVLIVSFMHISLKNNRRQFLKPKGRKKPFAKPLYYFQTSIIKISQLLYKENGLKPCAAEGLILFQQISARLAGYSNFEHPVQNLDQP